MWNTFGLSILSGDRDSILGDFSVHCKLWFSSPFTDHLVELAFNFAIPHDLKQLVKHPTHISKRLGATPNIPDPDFLTTNPTLLSSYLLLWAPLIKISYLNLILFLPSLLRMLKAEMFLAFCVCQLGDLKKYCADFL